MEGDANDEASPDRKRGKEKGESEGRKTGKESEWQHKSGGRRKERG